MGENQGVNLFPVMMDDLDLDRFRQIQSRRHGPDHGSRIFFALLSGAFLIGSALLITVIAGLWKFFRWLLDL